MRQIRLLKSQFQRIQVKARQAAEFGGAEVCGLILDTGRSFELVQVRNKTKRGGGFSFYFGEVRAIEKVARLRNLKIVGTFHSHPAALPKPGPADLCNAPDDSIMLIYDVIGRSARLWRVKNQKARQLHFSFHQSGRSNKAHSKLIAK